MTVLEACKGPSCVRAIWEEHRIQIGIVAHVFDALGCISVQPESLQLVASAIRDRLD